MKFRWFVMSIIWSLVVFLGIKPTWADGSIFHYPEEQIISIHSEKLGRCFGLLAVQYNKRDIFQREQMLCKNHQQLSELSTLTVNLLI